MGTSQGSARGDRQQGDGRRGITAVGYLLLFVLGVLEGCVGSFQYSQPPAPLIAIVLAVIVFVTCAGCGWGMGTVAAALLPGVGWIIAAFVLASGQPSGSVLITATPAGEWFLYGGALASVAGVLFALFARVRRPAAPR
jgi:Family of unknown function (DUF6113)